MMTFPSNLLAVKTGAKLTVCVGSAWLGQAMFADVLPLSDSAVDALIRQAPWAVALLIMCWLFLRYMGSVLKDHRATLAEFSKEHLEARRLTREALLKVAESTEANIAATTRNNDLLEQLAKQVEKQTERMDQLNRPHR